MELEVGVEGSGLQRGHLYLFLGFQYRMFRLLSSHVLLSRNTISSNAGKYLEVCQSLAIGNPPAPPAISIIYSHPGADRRGLQLLNYAPYGKHLVSTKCGFPEPDARASPRPRPKNLGAGLVLGLARLALCERFTARLHFRTREPSRTP